MNGARVICVNADIQTRRPSRLEGWKSLDARPANSCSAHRAAGCGPGALPATVALGSGTVDSSDYSESSACGERTLGLDPVRRPEGLSGPIVGGRASFAGLRDFLDEPRNFCRIDRLVSDPAGHGHFRGRHLRLRQLVF